MPNIKETPSFNVNERQIIHRMAEIGYDLVTMKADKTNIVFNAIGHKRPGIEHIEQVTFKNWAAVLNTITDAHGEDCISIEQANSDDRSERPVYKNTLDYAIRFKETDMYMNSIKNNLSCLEEIQTTIHENFDGLHIPVQKVSDLIRPPGGFGKPRMNWVLAHIVEANKDAYSETIQKWADKQIEGTIPKDAEDFKKNFPKEYGYSEWYSPYKAVQGIHQETEDNQVKSSIDKNGPVNPYLLEGFIKIAKPILNNEIIEDTAIRVNSKGEPQFETDKERSAGLNWASPCDASKGIYDYVALKLHGFNAEGLKEHTKKLNDLRERINNLNDHIEAEEGFRSKYSEDLQVARHEANLGVDGANMEILRLMEEIDSIENNIEAYKSNIDSIKQEIYKTELGKDDKGIELSRVKLYGERMEKSVPDKGTPIQAIFECKAESLEALEKFNAMLADDKLKINGIKVEMTATEDLEQFMEKNGPDKSLRKKILIYADKVPKATLKDSVMER